MEILLADSDIPTKRRVDIVADNFEGHTKLGIDVSIIDPRSSAYLSSKYPMAAGKAACDREDYKLNKYSAAFQRQFALFAAFVLESFGRFGDRTRELFDQLVLRVHKTRSHIPLSYFKFKWSTKIGMSMHINGSAGSHSRMNEVTRRRNGTLRAARGVNEMGKQSTIDDRVDIEHYSRTRAGR